MKLLLVSWFFPPSNTIAAVRMGKLARHLLEQGHELRVLTAAEPPYPASLAVEIDERLIQRCTWKDINALPDRALALFKPKRGTGTAAQAAVPPAPQAPVSPSSASPSGRLKNLRGKLSNLYQHLLNFPDKWVGWTPAARRAGLAMLRDWRPDGIFASGPPFTTLLVGYLLSRASGLPLVVEFRDRWSEDPYYPPPWWRRRLNTWLETRIVNHAVGITTVSEPWARRFRERFGKPVAVIANGFDAEDFPQDTGGGSGQGWPDPKVLRILYTGGIYPGYRDPSPLFAALADAPELRGRVEIHFYGSDPEIITQLAQAEGVTDCVRLHDRVTHAEALRLQLEADVLLLMQWDDPREQGNVPGKFAEYLGARRPILVLGYNAGVPAGFVRERGAGAASTDPQVLARQLAAWLSAKQRDGHLAPLSDAAVAGWSRGEQAARLGGFLESLFTGNPAEPPGGAGQRRPEKA